MQPEECAFTAQRAPREASEQPQNNEMQRTKHGRDGASPLISVLGRHWAESRS
jgi:hypothetical protein